MPKIDVSEKRRVTIGQMADFDFVDLCRKVHRCANTLIERPDMGENGQHTHCTVCDEPSSLLEFCMPCVREATKVIADTAAAVQRRFTAKTFMEARGISGIAGQ